ncbi:glycerol dehydratase reactivase beta/small subunit family protein [Schinkia sp. CFF1]
MKINTGNEVQAIHVYYSERLNNPIVLFQSLLNGAEEEGVPSFVERKQEKSALELSYQAALDSTLGVGIGVGDDSQIVLHYTKLPKSHPLFTINLNETLKQRVLGANAARLVKGIPFKTFEEIKETMNDRVEIEEGSITEEDIATIVTIVMKLLEEMKVRG